MNYRHGYHAGNHADVLKHCTVLALCQALTAKASACFALDTHAGRGLYTLDSEQALATGEADEGIGKLTSGLHPWLDAYLQAVDACRTQHGAHAYPGSPWLLAHALRTDDRIAACELQAEEALALKANFAHDKRIATHQRDGYAAIRALLPPRDGSRKLGRGLTLIDPPFEAQLGEFDIALSAIEQALTRWSEGMTALWYPIKRRRDLQPFYRRAGQLPCKSALVMELLIRADDSPLRMNGSGMLIINAPWQFDVQAQTALAALTNALGQHGASYRVDWLKAPV